MVKTVFMYMRHSRTLGAPLSSHPPRHNEVRTPTADEHSSTTGLTIGKTAEKCETSEYKNCGLLSGGEGLSDSALGGLESRNYAGTPPLNEKAVPPIGGTAQ